jgi:hypothetical protein
MTAAADLRLLPAPTFLIWFERLKCAITYDDAPLVERYLAFENFFLEESEQTDLLRLAIEEDSQRVLRKLLNSPTMLSWRAILLEKPEFIHLCKDGSIRILELILEIVYDGNSVTNAIDSELDRFAQWCIDGRLDSSKIEAVILLFMQYGLNVMRLNLLNVDLSFFFATIGCQQPLGAFSRPFSKPTSVEDVRQYEIYVKIGKRIARKKDVDKPLTVPERIDARLMHLRRACANLADICIAFHFLPALQTLLIVEHSCQLYHLLDEYVMYSKIVAVKNKAMNKVIAK